MTDLASAKSSMRRAALAARQSRQDLNIGAPRQAAGHLLEEIASVRHVAVISAYLPIRGELDPLPAMLALHGLHYRICVPVVEGKGRPLKFRAWTPDAKLAMGPFNVAIPESGDWLEPDLLVIPMLAFDGKCYRLGYGGGFYDRTLAAIRQKRAVVALGFAYSAQRVDALPGDPNDQQLEAVVTDRGIFRPS